MWWTKKNKCRHIKTNKQSFVFLTRWNSYRMINNLFFIFLFFLNCRSSGKFGAKYHKKQNKQTKHKSKVIRYVQQQQQLMASNHGQINILCVCCLVLWLVYYTNLFFQKWKWNGSYFFPKKKKLFFSSEKTIRIFCCWLSVLNMNIFTIHLPEKKVAGCFRIGFFCSQTFLFSNQITTTKNIWN